MYVCMYVCMYIYIYIYIYAYNIESYSIINVWEPIQTRIRTQEVEVEPVPTSFVAAMMQPVKARRSEWSKVFSISGLDVIV